MGQRTITGSKDLGNSIKTRRNELNLTIEEAASRAGVGTKTWCRYESGSSIRKDKYKGICKALNWHTLPIDEDGPNDSFDLETYKTHPLWSTFLSDTFGDTAAVSFVIGSEILLDYISEDMDAISAMPRGSQIGQLNVSFLKELLPEQFLMQYDYDFLYALYITVERLGSIAHAGSQMIAHSVMDELALYLIVEFSENLLEAYTTDLDENWKDWIFDLFDDTDLIYFLYSNNYVNRDNCYHFDHWMERQFYCE